MKIIPCLKLNFKRIGFILLIILVQPKIALTQDSITIYKIPTEKLTYKISTLILSGELPFIIEYRPSRIFGHEFSVGFAYMNFRLAAKNMLGVGYKIKYGLRLYLHKNEMKSRSWYISPQIFYKQLWLNHRDYNSDNNGIIGGGADTYDEYLYSESREVFGGQLLFGWAKTQGYEAKEFYFGFGLRYYNSYQKITKWLRVYGTKGLLTPTQAEHYPKTSKYLDGFSPSIHLGWNLSYPFYKKKK